MKMFDVCILLSKYADDLQFAYQDLNGFLKILPLVFMVLHTL